jgi:hypothetical protein
MMVVLWVDTQRTSCPGGTQAEPVALTIERGPSPPGRMIHGHMNEPHVVASVHGPDRAAEHAIRLLLLPALTRALGEPWPTLPADGPSAVAELLARACARPV